MGNNVAQEYSKSYTAFSGCDIVATFNGKVIGELQAITYNVTREKAPVYTMGSAEPRSFSRGKRGIAGTLVFTVFNRDALIEEFKPLLNGDTLGIQKYKMNDPSTVNKESGVSTGFTSIDDWDTQMTEFANGGSDKMATGTVSDLLGTYEPVYADEILPFDITITFANEYGQRAVLVIYGVELLNEGTAYSIDAVTTEKAYTFVARRVDYMKKIAADSDQGFSSTWRSN